MDELEAILETSGAAAVEIVASALAARGGPALNCANCGKPLIGPYCALGRLLHDFFVDLFSFDSRILRTVFALLFRPGELPRAFREGRTQRYMPALRLYLFVSLLFFLFLSLTGTAFLQLGLTLNTYSVVHDRVGNVYRIENGRRSLLPGMKSDAAGNVVKTGAVGTALPVTEFKADGSTNHDIGTKFHFFQREGTVHPFNTPELQKSLKDSAANARNTPGWGGRLERNFLATMQKLETDPAAINRPLTA